MKEKNKNKILKLDIARDGKGISKKEPLSPSGLKRFFLTVKDNFNKLILVNIIMVLGNLPLLFIIATLSGYTKNTVFLPVSDMAQNVFGFIDIAGKTPANMSLYAVAGLQQPVLVDSVLTYVFYGIGALTLLTFGIVNTGTAYVLRNIAMSEPVFVWTDFWYSVKRNLKQAIPFGIFDALVNVLLIFNLYTTMAAENFAVSLMFWSTVVIMLIYFSMRFYFYVQIVSFNLSFFKIIKNSFIFSLIGLKRNILALLGIAILIFLELMFLFVPGGILMSFAVAMPLIIFFSLSAYMKVYAAYFKIKEIIIDPYKAEHPELYPEEESYDEVIMRDDVTERERLEEIKKRNNIN
ncbi:MAG: hypothetical protein J6B48_08610 [Clostridia bacterium]|nr:hypothetical protein [Clostridia bacterium]